MKINTIILSIVTLLTTTQTIFCMFDADFGGFGNLNIKTGDIKIGDISILTTEITSCQNNVSSSCGAGSSCNVTIGPCLVKTGQKLNAAPQTIDFSRFLRVSDPLVITVNKPATIPVFNLDQLHNYTTIIRCPLADISYMFIALPTESTKIAMIKNLPLGLARYLKQKTGSFIKIYKTQGTSAAWSEISEIRIGKSLDDTVIKRSTIDSIEIDTNGNLVVTYKNLKKNNGTTIPTTRVTYTGQ